jgi:signal transduction histidine kinase
MTAAGAARPDPEDGTHTVANLLLFRASDAVAASIYLTVLPWWRPAGWLLLVTCTGTWRWWRNSRPPFLALPLAQRRALYRRRTWLHMASLGSAAFWLYAPDNPMLVILLGVHVWGMASVAALRLSSDFVRSAVALSLLVVPTSLHAIADGLAHDGWLFVLMGVGGFFMVATTLGASRLHERTLDQQVEQRRRAEQAADAVARVGLAKSRFFAAVSHDLRQPVHAIGLYLDPLIRYTQGQAVPQDVRRAVEGMRMSWKALDGLLAEVLDLTRMDAGVMKAHPMPVDLARLVRAVVMEQGAAAEARGLRLTALAGERRHAMADELMLKRVLSNLLDNAIKASPRGATVVVAVRRAPGRWRIQVRDAGPGIPAALQDQVFEEFVQVGNDARDRGKGYGLGLAISRRLAHLMQGTLTVRSDAGRGCTMTIALPATPAVPREPDLLLSGTFVGAALPFQHGTRLGRIDGAPPAHLRDVLVVEDDPLVAAALAQLLESWGHRTRQVESAAQALQACDAFQLAICDVRLPSGMSGLDLALALRQLGKSVLLVTGETDELLREIARAEGLELLVKPVAPGRLHAAIRGIAATDMTNVMP